MRKRGWVLYFLRCRGGRLYTGISNDLENRLKAHREGKGSKFVRAFSPFELAGTVSCRNGTEARRLEYRIKRLKRAEKLEFIESHR
ncbi:MAG TPA: GIY-YIG nuclease family protein [Dissulfurispiraceae bacterium]